jgi:signal recognition particle GTPase
MSDSGQLIVKIIHDEMTQLLGEKSHQFERSLDSATIIMLVGLQGSGKTTCAAKWLITGPETTFALLVPVGHLPTGG